MTDCDTLAMILAGNDLEGVGCGKYAYLFRVKEPSAISRGAGLSKDHTGVNVITGRGEFCRGTMYSEPEGEGKPLWDLDEEDLML